MSGYLTRSAAFGRVVFELTPTKLLYWHGQRLERCDCLDGVNYPTPGSDAWRRFFVRHIVGTSIEPVRGSNGRDAFVWPGIEEPTDRNRFGSPLWEAVTGRRSRF